MTIVASRRQADVASVEATDQEKIAFFELAEQLGHAGHWRISLPDYAVTWSKTVYQIHGLSPDLYAPYIKTAIGFYHPDDRDVVMAALTTAIRDESSFELSLRLIRADGELRHVRCRGLTIRGPDGASAAIFGVLVDVTEQHEARLELERIAYVDVLTGLANRRQFDGILEREWRRAAREHTALSLIMLDIDRFKSFNDLYGHLAGDGCLRLVAEALASVMKRPGDIASRYGGEEFALVLPTTEAAGAERVAQMVRSAVASLEIAHAQNASCGGFVTASLGLSTAYPQVDGTPKAWLDLIAEADAMLYEAKRTGRNRAVSLTTLGCDGSAPLLDNEEDRLAALATYEQAGATNRSAELDRIAKLAATMTSSPIGLVSLVGRDEQRFAGIFGLEGMSGTGRDVSFCAHTILGDSPFVVPDATRDSRFDGNTLVTGAAGLRYYAGAPIVSEATGHRLGALCVLDTSARSETTPAQRAFLTDLAKMVATLLEEKVASSYCA